MRFENVQVIYFSPSGTSKSVVLALVEGFEGVGSINETDLTHPGFLPCARLGTNDLAVIGVPVYAGRVPQTAVHRLKEITGGGTPVVIVAVYGNRAVEDALVELRDIAAAQGFEVVAASAFIGEHSYHTVSTPIAGGRPDAADLARAADFGSAVRQRLEDVTASAELVPVSLPDDRPVLRDNDVTGHRRIRGHIPTQFKATPTSQIVSTVLKPQI